MTTLSFSQVGSNVHCGRSAKDCIINIGIRVVRHLDLHQPEPISAGAPVSRTTISIHNVFPNLIFLSVMGDKFRRENMDEDRE
jgi:hypothetical protein